MKKAKLKLPVKFYVVFSRGAGRKDSPEVRLVKSGSKPMSVKPGEAQVALQLEFDEGCFEVGLEAPTLQIRTNDTYKLGRFTIVKEKNL